MLYFAVLGVLSAHKKFSHSRLLFCCRVCHRSRDGYDGGLPTQFFSMIFDFRRISAFNCAAVAAIFAGGTRIITNPPSSRDQLKDEEQR